MRTLLFVGDRDVLDELPTRGLGAAEFRTLGANTGRQTFDLVERERPDVVILFVERGIDVRAAFASVLAEERGIPVVICTTTSACSEEVSGWPADAILVAPGELGELISAIRSVLERRTAAPVPAGVL